LLGSEYRRLDGLALLSLVRAGEVARSEVIDCAEREIDRINPVVNAVNHRFRIPEEPAGGRLAGSRPMEAVPLLVKDTGLQIKDTPLSSGAELFADNICKFDSSLALRYLAAGMVVLGRTNSPEFALSFTTEGTFFGPTRNPWDLSRSPGGSSGGSAVAVACGMVPVAHASDGAGSIRVPAAHCGVFGFKPSRMRNPLGPVVAEGNAGMSTPHVITRSVRDSAAMLDVSSGPDVGDPYAAPPVAGSFAAALSSDPKPLRIGITVSSPIGSTVAPECVEAAHEAARLCEALGHHVEFAHPDYDAASLQHAWRVIGGVSLANQIRGLGTNYAAAEIARRMEPVNAQWLAEGRGWTGQDYLDAVSALHRSARRMGAFFQRYDVLLSPVTAQPAPRLGVLKGGAKALDAFYREFWEHAPFTWVFNTSGCPAMSVPLCWGDEDGERTVPIGVQFGAAYGNDALLFGLAGQLERASPWAHRYERIRLEAVASEAQDQRQPAL